MIPIVDLSNICHNISASSRDTKLYSFVYKRKANSQIYKHLEESGHTNFDWNNVKVLRRSSKKDSRLFLESSFTYVNVNSINRCADVLELLL